MGCDITILTMSISVPCFNPRTHMGCDLPCHKYQGATTVSIHAPTWGATTVVMHRPEQNCEFQSTHPHGVRPYVYVTITTLSRVSIHAPTWGATKEAVDGDEFRVFQSTHPHGVRPLCNSILSHLISFNPRTHMGCDTLAVGKNSWE